MNSTQAGQSGAVGTKSVHPGPYEDLQGPKKGLSGPKGALLGPPGPQKGPNTRSQCGVTMNPTQAGQSGAVGTESASPGPSEDLQGPKRVLSGPKRNLFACFLELGGSIWTITVLNERGIPLRRSGHPTSLYLEQKEFPKKLGRGNLVIGPG